MKSLYELSLSNDTKKAPSKHLAYQEVCDLLDELIDRDTMGLQLATLVSQLKSLSPVTNKKSKSSWAILCDNSAKKDVRYYLNGIRVIDENTLVSSDGYRLCKVEKKHNLIVGSSYEMNKKAELLIDGSSEWKYPDFNKVFIESSETVIVDHFNVDEMPIKKNRVVTAITIEDTLFDIKYIQNLRIESHTVIKLIKDSGLGSLLKVVTENEYETITQIVLPIRK